MEDLVSHVMDITIQLLLALKHLHQLGIIHRDVKTKNILTGRLLPGSPSLRAKLGDFGIARILGSGFSRGGESAKLAKTMIGTPYYSCPEIFSGSQAELRGRGGGAEVLFACRSAVRL